MLSKHCQKVVLQLIKLLSFHYSHTGSPTGYTEQIYAKLQSVHLLSDVTQVKDEVLQKMDSAYLSKLRQVFETAEQGSSQHSAMNDSVFLTQTS
ncbi:hypothetical protein EON65_11340 [archaeon]|nr:MAG: hypothetical protein EON65_11340 [archaeon]